MFGTYACSLGVQPAAHGKPEFGAINTIYSYVDISQGLVVQLRAARRLRVLNAAEPLERSHGARINRRAPYERDNRNNDRVNRDSSPLCDVHMCTPSGCVRVSAFDGGLLLKTKPNRKVASECT